MRMQPTKFLGMLALSLWLVPTHINVALANEAKPQEAKGEGKKSDDKKSKPKEGGEKNQKSKESGQKKEAKKDDHGGEGEKKEAKKDDHGGEGEKKDSKKKDPKPKRKNPRWQTVVPKDAGKGIRDECRTALAGLYVSAYNDAETYDLKVKSLEKSTRELKTAIIAKRSELDATVLRYKDDRFDLKSERAIAVLKDQVRLFEHHLTVDSDLLASAKEKYAENIKRRDDLGQKLEGVFSIDRTVQSPGYNINVQYRSGCEKYHWVCPLPEDQRKALDAMLGPVSQITATPVPESCRKYAQTIDIKP